MSWKSFSRSGNDFTHGAHQVSIDEDEDARSATDFWSEHGFPWSDFHDSNGEIAQKFLQSGIPQYVLIDASGKVVFVAGGAGPERLRAAIAKLGNCTRFP